MPTLLKRFAPALLSAAVAAAAVSCTDDDLFADGSRDIVREGVPVTVNPVSYTHLDVYKRQEAETVGLSYGYMFPVGRSLSFEAGIGIGYMHSEYEEYLPIDGHYVYQQTSRMNYFGPLKLKFALVWRLWNTDGKKGGVR